MSINKSRIPNPTTLLLAMLFAVCMFQGISLAQGTGTKTKLPLIPQPRNVSVDDRATLKLPATISFIAPDAAAWEKHVEIVGLHVERMTGGKHRLVKSTESDATLVVAQNKKLAPEAYSLDVTKNQIQLSASTLKGLAHGTSTLLQLVGGLQGDRLPSLSIRDEPHLSYRNFLVDMGRNPHSVELLKETIDLLWFYKIDSMQLHLTDDQRFAFPSTAFPKLWDGIITVDQFKELEAYAVCRGVTIIPELEVPGHSGILRRGYPETFGKTQTELATTDKAFTGITTLLDEMMDVFSSTPYIHVGGDEVSGVPEESQRELINRLHAYLKSKGRQTIVWEGPRPGKGKNKVNTEVIHLNWRMVNYSPAQMLKDGYRVVNAAWDPLYIVDHYPRTNFTMAAPQYVYEKLSLTCFQHVNPRLSSFTNPVEVQPNERLIGFCMPWWEGREENFIAMNVPRVIPFAEVAWDPSVVRDFTDFSKRLAKTEAARQSAFYAVQLSASNLAVPADGVFHNSTAISLETNSLANERSKKENKTQIHYTIDKSEPNLDSPIYESPIELNKSTHIRAAAFSAGKQVGHGIRQTFTAVAPEKNLALGKPVKSSGASGSPFSVQRVTDGGTENLNFYLGYPAIPEPILVTIDLEEVQQVSSVTVTAYTISDSYEKYKVEVSIDGEEFTEVASRMDKPEKPTSSVAHKFETRDIRYVRIRSHGNHGYVFDSFSKLIEVQVNK